MKETLNLKGSKATGPSLLNLRHIHIIDSVKGSARSEAVRARGC